LSNEENAKPDVHLDRLTEIAILTIGFLTKLRSTTELIGLVIKKLKIDDDLAMQSVSITTITAIYDDLPAQ
jgi:hypothetical protein